LTAALGFFAGSAMVAGFNIMEAVDSGVAAAVPLAKTGVIALAAIRAATRRVGFM
jgi:hypothetical protein